MAVTTDILQSWRDPRGVLRAKLDEGVNEARALAVVMGACVLIFVAQWPRLAREAHFGRIEAERAGTPPDQVPDLQALIGANLFALIFVVPLLLYGVALILHGLLRLAGGRGAVSATRLALFWALLAVTPAMLFQGLVAGLVGPGPALTATGIAVFGLFAWIVVSMQREAHWP
jgi:hypothetical protein